MKILNPYISSDGELVYRELSEPQLIRRDGDYAVYSIGAYVIYTYKNYEIANHVNYNSIFYNALVNGERPDGDARYKYDQAMYAKKKAMSLIHVNGVKNKRNVNRKRIKTLIPFSIGFLTGTLFWLFLSKLLLSLISKM